MPAATLIYSLLPGAGGPAICPPDNRSRGKFLTKPKQLPI